MSLKVGGRAPVFNAQNMWSRKLYETVRCRIILIYDKRKYLRHVKTYMKRTKYSTYFATYYTAIIFVFFKEKCLHQYNSLRSRWKR